MIFDLEEVLIIHQILIEEFGGSSGVKDKGLLESALMRPSQTFEAEELYPTTESKAAAILESVVVNHPFVDGNKRTGYVLMRLILLEDGIELEASQDEKYHLVMEVAKGNYGYERILLWIEAHKKE